VANVGDSLEYITSLVDPLAVGSRSVCTSVSSSSQHTSKVRFTELLDSLHVAVAQSSSDDVAISSVLWAVASFSSSGSKYGR